MEQAMSYNALDYKADRLRYPLLSTHLISYLQSDFKLVEQHLLGRWKRARLRGRFCRTILPGKEEMLHSAGAGPQRCRADGHSPWQPARAQHRPAAPAPGRHPIRVQAPRCPMSPREKTDTRTLPNLVFQGGCLSAEYLSRAFRGWRGTGWSIITETSVH